MRSPWPKRRARCARLSLQSPRCGFAAENRTNSWRLLIVTRQVKGRRKSARFRLYRMQKFFGRILSHEATPFEQRDARTQKKRFPHVMRDKHNGFPKTRCESAKFSL